ncbi:hypothetical protein, partial [Staphylococcus aureus]
MHPQKAKLKEQVGQAIRLEAVQKADEDFKDLEIILFGDEK